MARRWLHPNTLTRLLWLEPAWIVLLGLPLTLPGRFIPIQWTPTLCLLLFLFWPLRALSWGWAAAHARRRYQSLPRPPAHPLTLPILALLATLPFSYTVAADQRQAWLMLAHLLLGVTLCVALIEWSPRRYIRWILEQYGQHSSAPSAQSGPIPSVVVAWGAAGLLIVAALILSVFGPPMLGSRLPSPRDAAFFAPLRPVVQSWGEAINANILAGGLLPAVPLLVGIGLAPWTGASVGAPPVAARLIGGARTLLCLGAAWWLVQVMTLTASRGALMAVVVSVGLVLVLRWPRLRWPALALVGLTLLWFLLNDPWTRLRDFMNAGMGADYNGRMEIWVRSWRVLWAHPLTGIGIGSFVPVVVEQTPPVRETLSPQVTHAHNLLLQVGVDLGLVGMASYTACLVLSGVWLARAWRAGRAQGAWGLHTLGVAGLGALAALLVHGMVDAPLWNSKLAFLPWVLMAMGVCAGEAAQAAPSRSASGS